MHIMEGYLPLAHALGWSAASAPFVVWGGLRLRRTLAADPSAKFALAAAGAFSFVLSALKLPSVTGSCSHPTGTGLGAIQSGPQVMAFLGSLVLLFQALLLAHGGLTTLGANIFSMAIVGPWVSWAIWRGGLRLGLPLAAVIFAAAAVGDLATYLTTSVQLALAYPAADGGVLASLGKFSGIFALTQVPLAIAEGLVTVVVLNALGAGRSLKTESQGA